MKRQMVAVLLGAMLGACGGGSTGTDAGGGGGNAANGLVVASMAGCAACHGADFGGGATLYGGVAPPNLTPDAAHGLGGWTDAQIITAVRTGVDDEGATLCSSMPRYPMMSDSDAADLVAYLRSLAPSTNDAPAGTCTAP